MTWPIIVKKDGIVTAAIYAPSLRHEDLTDAIRSRNWAQLMTWGVKWWDQRNDQWQTYWGPELVGPFRIPRRRRP